MCVSNGNLRRSSILTDGFTRYDWFVSYPINNYNVTLNIADYERFSDSYIAQDGDKLALSYYVLRYNVDKARKQFEQVKPMLACYEKLFGKYPFWKDGYALVETPYLGMEHQGAIAYGNKYLQGYAGQDPSGTGIGLTFDYIIIHESGHEYWGNSVSSQDHGEMWIHESFCTYTEALYVECMQNKDAASKYMVGLRELIENKEPIIAPLGVNASGSADMYYKGANILHTLRHVIDNDKLWFEILHGIAQEFKNKTTNTQEIIQFINTKAGKDFTPFFDQYLRHTKLPVFQYMLRQRGKKVTLEYRWQADVPNFQMPLKVDLGDGNYIPVTPSQHWQTITQKGNAGKFKVANDQYYIAIQKVESEKTKP
jgi:aminopeptidase N